MSKKKVGTKEFAEAVIKNLGQQPSILKHINYDKNTALIIPIYQRKEAKNKTLVGIVAAQNNIVWYEQDSF